jgi:hypothetical protein
LDASLMHRFHHFDIHRDIVNRQNHFHFILAP